MVFRSQPDFKKANLTRNFVESWAVSGNELCPLTAFPSDIGTVKVIGPSPSGEVLAMVRKVDKIEHLEIWDGCHIRHSIELTEFHGTIYKDGFHFIFVWFTASDQTFI